MEPTYYKHCGSFHPLPLSYVQHEDGTPITYTQIITCPICGNFLWLSHAYTIGK